MQEKKYLNFGQKLAYGLGDFGGNFCYTFVSSFVLIYLTDIVGLNSAIIGVLMMISKIFDGFTDILFGTIIDRTHTKWGKARPWFIIAIVPLAICTFLEFSIPAWSQGLQYAYFFIVYTLLNAGFFTIFGVAFQTLSALITKNKNERVQLGVFRYVFALSAAMLISMLTTILVQTFGGGAAGWRTVAMIYAGVILATQFIVGLVCKELPPEELYEAGQEEKAEKLSFWKTMKYLATNKYFLMILGIYVGNQLMNTISQSVGIYYVTYIIGNDQIFGLFSMAGMLPMILGLFLTPMLVKKFGIFKTNIYTMIIAIVLGIPFILVGLKKQVMLMLILLAVRGIFTAPITGTLGALTAEASRNAYLRHKVHLDGSMFACSSMGTKVGSGIGVAVFGWLLNLSHYDGLAATQPQSALDMITVMYLVFPVLSIVIQLLFMSGLNVEKANAQLEAANK